MTNKFIEQLPGEQSLYSVAINKPILPGQWLSSNQQHFPVLYSKQHEAQIITPNNSVIPENLTISGQPLIIPDDGKKLLLFADNKAVPMMFYLIRYLRDHWGMKKLSAVIELILMGTDNDYPFKIVPSTFLLSGMPEASIASAQLLEDWHLPARLATLNYSPGCYTGSVVQFIKQINFQQYLINENRIVVMGTSQLNNVAYKLFNKDNCTHSFLTYEYN